jgi:hypothetical protein
VYYLLIKRSLIKSKIKKIKKLNNTYFVKQKKKKVTGSSKSVDIDLMFSYIEPCKRFYSTFYLI